MTPETASLIAEAAELAKLAPEALSEFEAQLIADVAYRRATFGELAAVTAPEVEALNDAIDGMGVFIAQAFYRAKIEERRR